MTKLFVDRKNEFQELDLLEAEGGLAVIYGRRRVGKSRLLTEWLKGKRAIYSQAVEGTASLQLSQIVSDMKEAVSFPAEPRTWEELFSVWESQSGPLVVCLDEFPYLVASDSSLPSRLQRYVDHRKKEDLFIILAGSSTRMMHDMFLNANSPLFDRASKVIRLLPLSYTHFCEYFRLKKESSESFLLYSLAGGIPKYWEWLSVARKMLSGKMDVVSIADALYFSESAWMEQEPQRVMTDEKIHGIMPLSVLEAIGRGASKPGEIASRLGVPQNNLPKVTQQLVDAGIVDKEIPFGISSRDAKRTLYAIVDPAIRFWFGVYSVHRSGWRHFSRLKKRALIESHCGFVFERAVRHSFPGASRYWERDIELDIVQEGKKGELSVAELKFGKQSSKEEERLRKELEDKYMRSTLSHRFKKAAFRVIDARFLGKIR